MGLQTRSQIGSAQVRAHGERKGPTVTWAASFEDETNVGKCGAMVTEQNLWTNQSDSGGLNNCKKELGPGLVVGGQVCVGESRPKAHHVGGWGPPHLSYAFWIFLFVQGEEIL